MDPNRDDDRKMNKTKIKPRIKFYEAEYYLKDNSLNPRIIENLEVYNLVKELTNKAYFSSRDKYEKYWEGFYLPLKRTGKVISIPFNIVKYKKDFFCNFFQMGNLEVRKGNKEAEKIYKKIFQEAIRFTHLIRQTQGEIVEKTLPYDFRTGKIKGKYILDKLLPQEEKEKIIKDYNRLSKNNFNLKGCSLNEYFNITSICYKSVFGKKVAKLSPLEMYKRFADGRDGGMLSIKNWESRREFLNWYKDDKWSGSHPFEIIFSWHRHGIHLYPPSSYNSWRYSLRVTNYSYAEDYIKMVRILIKRKVPFIAYNLEEVLDYLRGETYFTVNTYSDNPFSYIPCQEYKKNYFKYIEWDNPKILKWEKRNRNETSKKNF